MKNILTLCTIVALAVSIMFTALSLTGCDNGGDGSGTDLGTTPPTVPPPIKAGLYMKDSLSQIDSNVDEPIVDFDKEDAGNTFTEAIEKAITDGGSYILVLDGDVQVNSVFNLNVTPPRTLSLKIIGLDSNRVISYPSLAYDSLFTVSGSGSDNQLILDNNITLKGGEGNYCSLVTVNGGFFTMKPGSAIKDNTNIGPEAKGGGVSVLQGVFMMEGGEISGNKAICNTASSFAGGGGVFVDEYGLFFMKGGEISSNTCENSPDIYGELNGGGVYIWGGSFYMFSGQISDNTAEFGGGVCMDGENPTFIMDNGNEKISDNKAAVGGGVFIWSGNFTMEKGEISTNKAKFNGGGVFVGSGGTFTMKNGKISGNKTLEAGGGGVFVDEDGPFTMEGGEISSNNAPSGGGVFVWNGTFTMQGGEISSNNATSTDPGNSGGGGVYVYQGTFILKNTAVIKNNTAATYGGGVYIEDDTFTMEGGEILSNNAVFGGGVLLKKGTFTMKDGKIYGTDAGDKANTVPSHGDGAAIYNDGGTANYDAPLTPGIIVSSGGGFCNDTIPGL
jgi:hypothetical protein